MTADRRGGHAPVRISDVAREAGVSAQTVSNVVNARPGFSEETRARVLAAIERTGYRPNRVARNLRSRRSGQLGLHLPARHLSVRNTFSVNFLKAVIDATGQADHQLVVFTQSVTAGAAGTDFASSGVDGFILCNVDPDDLRPRLLVDAGVPFAAMGRIEPPLPQSWVDIDNAAAMATLVDRVVGQGHRRLAYVGYDEPEYWNRERFEGTQKRLAEHGLAIPERWTLHVDLDSVREAVERRLFDGERPEAIICSSDSLAVVVHSMASRRGLTPGRDIAITGFDALPLAGDVDPPLTSVEIPLATAARAVVEMVIRQIEGEPAPEHGTILPTRLAIGGSG